MVDDGPPLVVPYSGSFGVAEKIRRLDDGLHWLESGTATLTSSTKGGNATFALSLSIER